MGCHAIRWVWKHVAWEGHVKHAVQKERHEVFSWTRECSCPEARLRDWSVAARWKSDAREQPMLGGGLWLFWWGRLERGSSRQDSTLGQVRLARDFRALAARSWCLASDASHTVRNDGSMPQALADPRLARGMRRKASLARLPDGTISSPALHQSSRRYEQCNAEDGRQMSMPPAALPGVAAAGRPRCSRVHLFEVRISGAVLTKSLFRIPRGFSLSSIGPAEVRCTRLVWT